MSRFDEKESHRSPISALFQHSPREPNLLKTPTELLFSAKPRKAQHQPTGREEGNPNIYVSPAGSTMIPHDFGPARHNLFAYLGMRIWSFFCSS